MFPIFELQNGGWVTPATVYFEKVRTLSGVTTVWLTVVWGDMSSVVHNQYHPATSNDCRLLSTLNLSENVSCINGPKHGFSQSHPVLPEMLLKGLPWRKFSYRQPANNDVTMLTYIHIMSHSFPCVHGSHENCPTEVLVSARPQPDNSYCQRCSVCPTVWRRAFSFHHSFLLDHHNSPVLLHHYNGPVLLKRRLVRWGQVLNWSPHRSSDMSVPYRPIQSCKHVKLWCT